MGRISEPTWDVIIELMNKVGKGPWRDWSVKRAYVREDKQFRAKGWLYHYQSESIVDGEKVFQWEYQFLPD